LGPGCFLNTHAEGIKQLKPDTTYVSNLLAWNAGYGYNCFATELCGDDQKLYIRIGSSSEKVYLGFGTTLTSLTFRIKLSGVVVFGPMTINALTKGYIRYYKQAIAGPNVINPAGYNPLVFYPGSPGDYSIEFDPISIAKFDITVIDTVIQPLTAIDGRLWSKDWRFVTEDIAYPNDAFLATQYIYSDDSIVTSVYYNHMQGDDFDVTSTSNGCLPSPAPWDSSCMSRPGDYHYAQYKIFINNPDSVQFPTGHLGLIDISSINVSPQCNGSFVISFIANKPGKVNISIEVNPAPGHQPEDVSIIDTAIIGLNTIIWNGHNGLGNPLPDGTPVGISISYVNGLTNLALYDVERHLYGFIIQLVRPSGPPIATYWNDTLLANKGGTVQLTGCYGSYPSTGCHAWDGNYYGVGLGSWNTVNTWWYATSSSSNLGTFMVTYGPIAPDSIIGPEQLCLGSNVTYTVSPDPLPNADPGGYEWVLIDVATGFVLFDLTNQGTYVNINFSLYPLGDKRLKVRGSKSSCGWGPFGPGMNGEGILINSSISPQITNSITTYNLCSGDVTNILLQATQPSTTYTYSASASSIFLSGYSSGSLNPIQQTLINSGPTADTVKYRVVPYLTPCSGDTVSFYMIVSPRPQVTNSLLYYFQCSGISTNIILATDIPGATFSWTASGSSPDITGFTNGSGQVIAQMLVNSGSGQETVTYSVIASLNGCSGSVKNFVVTVYPNLTVSVSITASSNPFCAGSPVTFIATPTNGGSSPQYQWKVNGSNAGTNSPNFTYNPANGDLVSCTLISSEPCTSGNPASSITITMTINNNLPAGITITPSSNPFCPGLSVTFLATAVNGGSAPVYQWKVNGINVGTNASTFIYNPVNNDSVRCVMTSNLACVTGNPASSAKIIMSGSLAPIVTFTSCFDTITTINATPIKLKGGIPLGGTYSGPGVNSLTGIYTPSLAGVGTKTITYTYTNAALCTAAKSISILNLQSSIFSCGNTLMDIRDNKIYPTVQIGFQCWMASNLNYGNTISSTQDQRDNCVSEKYCYSDNPGNCTNYGGLYQWDELMRYDESPATQGFCPPGWHIPDESEWNILFANYINNAFAASPLKYSGYSGFNALLTGARHINRTWDFQAFAAFFWSSTALGNTKAWSHGMNDYDPSVSVYPASRANAFSVRCIKD
jgi:uncharacterized protein (TIGR02145 family)